jgi:uncharacterized protein
MKYITLKFYVNEKQRLHGKLLYEWLLEEAMRLGISGGSAYRAVAGFGRHGKLHEETFFELAGEMPVQVEFVVEASVADKMLEVVRPHNLNLFYLRQEAEAGVI